MGVSDKTVTMVSARSTRAGLSRLRRSRTGGQILFGAVTLGLVLGMFVILRFIPIVQTFFYSLHNWRLGAPSGAFVGANNFAVLVGDSGFQLALKNTMVFCLVTTPLTLLLSLGLAELLNRRIHKPMYYELMYLVPVIMSMVPVSIVWKWIYEPQHGLLNHLVSLIGIAPQAWLLNPKLVMPSIIAMSVWKQIGFYMVIFLVGLKSIPSDYYEAAEIDGAGWWSAFSSITLPLLKPITLYAVVWSTITNLNVFTQVYVMTLSYGATGAFGQPVRVLVLDIYENAFKFTRMGYGSAEAVVLFVIVLLISLAQLRLLKESE